jgi:hypothetical protein
MKTVKALFQKPAAWKCAQKFELHRRAHRGVKDLRSETLDHSGDKKT